MADVSKEKRQKIMASIRSKDTRPEVFFRRQLFAEGIRYGLHNKKLKGKPDLSLPKYNCIIFINGCFWHHHSCKDGHYPKSNPEFWKQKIDRNIERDKENIQFYKDKGIRVAVVWECTITQMKKDQDYCKQVINRTLNFLKNEQSVDFIEIQ